MSIIIPANTLAAGGFDVDNSVRFNDGDSAYMHKTAAAGNRRTFTFSTWFKRGQLGTNQQLFNSYSAANAGGFAYMQLEAIESGVVGDRISLEVYGTILLKTTQVLRDPSSWYHLVIAVDTTSGTANNRCRMYLNGTEITDFVTRNNPDQNFDFAFNQNNIDMYLGSNNYGGNKGNYFDGYMAEVVWIDGTQYAATDFGEFDEDSNIWKPLESVSDLTFGTNGFYLDFKASGNLGNDANGGTDLTEVNLAATDQSTDTCTNNFTLWNALNQQSSISYSEGNTTFINSSGGNRMAFSNFGVTAGKWYAELKVGVVHNHMRLGVADISFYIPVTNAYSTNLPNSISYANDNPIYIGGSSQGDFGSFTTDDIISIVMDMDNGFVYFAKNGTYLNSGDPTSGSDGTGGFAIPNYTTKTYCFLGSSYDGGTDATVLANFGSPSYSESGGETDGNGYGNFAHAVPSGYFSLNTKNLAENG